MFEIEHLIKISKWDSQIFSENVGIAHLDKKLSLEEIEAFKIESKKYKFIVVKDSTHNFQNSEAISKKLGGFIVDLNVQFSKKTTAKKIDNNSDSAVIIDKKALDKYDILQVAKIASSSFVHSRFYSDQNIDDSLANRVFETWIKDAFLNINKNFIVYKNNEKICGFLLYSVNEHKKIITIELIAVDQSNVSEGIGRKMINKLEEIFSSARYKEFIINVGTQVNNLNAMNFYIKNNYRIIKETRTFHIWN